MGDFVRDLVRDVLVVVPARNEEQLLPGCLDSLDAAHATLARADPAIRVTTVVVLDRCTDASAELVDARSWVHAARSEAGCVGAARRLGVAAAIGFAGRPDPGATWIASTDADSVVPPHWLSRQLELACAGADLVLGTVVPEVRGVDPELIDAWHARHLLTDGHPYVHGANLGVRLSIYLQAGGFAELPVHEDVRLVEAIRRDGGAVVSTASAPVVTSGRFEARAPEGFASYLRALADPDLGLPV